MRKKLIIVAVLIGAVAACLWFWPSPGYDVARVHPSLRDLAAPYRSVFTSSFLDGGSIGVRIVDRDGRIAKFALPVGSGRRRTYPRLLHGAEHSSDTNAVEIVFNEDTRRVLISVIDAHRNPADMSELALAELRGGVRDYARLFGRFAINKCKQLVP